MTKMTFIIITDLLKNHHEGQKSKYFNESRPKF